MRKKFDKGNYMTVDKKTDSSGNVHYVGKKRLVDLSTGEEFEAQTIVKSVGDQDFKKIFLTEVLERIEAFSSAKMKFIFWFLENADKQNRVIGSVAQLAERSGISFATVARLLPVLKKTDVIRLISPSVYMLNPEILAAVTSNKRGNLLIQYKSLDKKSEVKSEQSAEEAE